MIAVGGDVLSRGLTLDGLTVELLPPECGRLGHPPPDGPLVRLPPRLRGPLSRLVPDEVADQFSYVAGIVDELRGQLRAMKKQGPDA